VESDVPREVFVIENLERLPKTEDAIMKKKLQLVVVVISAVATPMVIAMATPKWEAVSIRPTKECAPPPGPAAVKGDKKGPDGPIQGPSPGRVTMCTTVANLIPQAYVYNATGQASAAPKIVSPVPIEGAPAWIASDLFQINAKAEGTPIREMLWGPMMQALLEDRFKLKIRREVRDVPAYALAVAKGGPKIQPLRGTCAPSTFPPPPKAPGEIDCGPQGTSRKGPNMAWGFIGSADEFSKILNSMLDRPVIDKTGLAGVFNFHVEFAPDETSPGFVMRLRTVPEDGGPSDPTGGTSIFTAMQEQLGLRLEPAKGPKEFLVVEHVERPSGN
jgi:uncharacterized protein (TIGR03435 family)